MFDKSEPKEIREFMANFFERKVFTLQHKKNKVLSRWAHFALTSEYLDRIGHHGSFVFSRL